MGIEVGPALRDLTLEELLIFDWKNPDFKEIFAPTLNQLKALDDNPANVRCIFWLN